MQEKGPRWIGRVLRPSGSLIISIVRPFADRGRFAGPERDAPFILLNSCFGWERFEGVEERNGFKMHFAGWSQPLENYMATKTLGITRGVRTSLDLMSSTIRVAIL